MNNEDYCPFYFGLSYGHGYCVRSVCALWVDEGEDSACGLAYEALLLAKNRKRLAKTRWLTTGEKIKIFDRDGGGDS